jgi:hypothetical protein
MIFQIYWATSTQSFLVTGPGGTNDHNCNFFRHLHDLKWRFHYDRWNGLTAICHSSTWGEWQLTPTHPFTKWSHMTAHAIWWLTGCVNGRWPSPAQRNLFAGSTHLITLFYTPLILGPFRLWLIRHPEHQIYRRNRTWKHIGVSCEVWTSSTYKKLKPSQYQTVKTYVSCEVRTSSTYKQ